MARALILVDLQYDFYNPQGALYVPRAHEVLAEVQAWEDTPFDLVVATRDWHSFAHCSFDYMGGPFPAHCIQGTGGARLAYGVDQRAHLIVSKGMEDHKEEFSGWTRNLEVILKGRFATSDEIVIMGLATEYCVRATVLDALRSGFRRVTVPVSGVRGIEAVAANKALIEMEDAGARLSL